MNTRVLSFQIRRWELQRHQNYWDCIAVLSTESAVIAVRLGTTAGRVWKSEVSLQDKCKCLRQRVKVGLKWVTQLSLWVPERMMKKSLKSQGKGQRLKREHAEKVNFRLRIVTDIECNTWHSTHADFIRVLSILLCGFFLLPMPVELGRSKSPKYWGFLTYWIQHLQNNHIRYWHATSCSSCLVIVSNKSPNNALTAAFGAGSKRPTTLSCGLHYSRRCHWPVLTSWLFHMEPLSKYTMPTVRASEKVLQTKYEPWHECTSVLQHFSRLKSHYLKLF